MIYRILNNLDIFISGIFFIIAFGYILYLLTGMVHKAITKTDKREAKLDILLLPFIIFCMILAISIGISGWKKGNITEANLLMATVSFISPFIAFTGAYAIFEFGQNKSDRENKEKENKEKLAKKEQYEKDIEHKKHMLFTMLEYSYTQTRIPSQNIKKVYREHYKHLTDKLKLNGDIMDDFTYMLRVKPCQSTEDFDGFLEWVSEQLTKDMNKKQIAKRVIYIENWYDYLDCVPNLDDINSIVFWITMLKSSDSSIDVHQFLSNRSNIDTLIRKYYPKVIDEGLRGKLSRIYIEEQ